MEKTIPFDIEAEASLLATLFNPGAIDVVRTSIKPDDFYKTIHGKIYEAMLKLSDREAALYDFEAPEYLSIKDRHGQNITINGMTVADYLTYLYKQCKAFPAVNAGYYADKVKQASQCRYILRATKNIKLGADAVQDTKKPMGRLSEAIDKANLIAKTGKAGDKLPMAKRSKKATKNFTIIPNIILESITISGFNMTERRCLDLVIRLSYGCNKAYASFVNWSDFDAVGVKKQNIKKTLGALKKDRVLLIDEENKTIRINENCEEWLNRGITTNSKRYRELIKLNLKKNNQTPKNSIENRDSKSNPQITSPVIQQLPNSNPPITKSVIPRLPQQDVNPSNDAVLPDPKYNIKDNLKTTKPIDTRSDICNIDNNKQKNIEKNIETDNEDMGRKFDQDFDQDLADDVIGKLRSFGTYESKIGELLESYPIEYISAHIKILEHGFRSRERFMSTEGVLIWRIKNCSDVVDRKVPPIPGKIKELKKELVDTQNAEDGKFEPRDCEKNMTQSEIRAFRINEISKEIREKKIEQYMILVYEDLNEKMKKYQGKKGKNRQQDIPLPEHQDEYNSPSDFPIDWDGFS